MFFLNLLGRFTILFFYMLCLDKSSALVDLTCHSILLPAEVDLSWYEFYQNQSDQKLMLYMHTWKKNKIDSHIHIWQVSKTIQMFKETIFFAQRNCSFYRDERSQHVINEVTTFI